MVFGIKMRIEPKTFVSLRDGGLGQTVLIGRSPVRHWPTFHQKVEDLRSLLWVLPPGQGLLRRPQRG